MDINIYNLYQSSQYSDAVLRRKKGWPKAQAAEVNFAYESLEYGEAFFESELNVDTTDVDVKCLVNYDIFSNVAMWDKPYLVLGSGDTSLNNMAFAIDVIVHELTHIVLEKDSMLRQGLEHQGINEHICDVIGLTCRYYAYQTPPEDFTWLIGDLIAKDNQRRAIRDLANPGSAHPNDRQTSDLASLMRRPNWQLDTSSYDLLGPLNYLFFVVASSGIRPLEDYGKIWWESVKNVPAHNALFHFLSNLKSTLEEERTQFFSACEQIGLAHIPNLEQLLRA
ncbi:MULTISPECIES: M4 family metallopeptidase [Pseudoalteromonas]|uniref:M4 family metallopeptidase n=1 Tax=Pseudoalteromonas maricaloris TaxID=184924 RepID=A0A8I2H276_9GAMM|nr:MULTISPECIES: M4 family metallopeptidase [Pseudoalteromonas]NKC19997.1 peptidase [Pseudoalteromonas galatheae]NLR21708.1 M4 family metallopeptidase [Pseudoalteromonas maricaloris]USE70554.1 peptidase [Pseudoalteromonas flavipulchra]WOX28248.1 M4 family metallopeptidase [Pseudoalteromonas maricaloris]